MKPIRLALSVPFEKLDVAASRFWGNPALPTEMPWPSYIDSEGDEMDYTFLCQVNLRDVAPYDVEGLLPSEGLLLFFAKVDHYLGHFECDSVMGAISDEDDVRVIFLPSTEGLVEKVLVDEVEEPISPQEWQVDFTHQFDPLCDDDHALLAEPTHREWETWDAPYEDWQILLQVDSFQGMDFNLNFMDMGVLDILVHPDDLGRGDFSHCRGIVLST